MLPISSTKLALLIGLVSVTKEVQAVQRGVAWAVNDQWAPAFTDTSITWYHHWQDPAVSQMASNIQYVPMNWGPKYTTLWQQREAQMNASLPEYLLSYNEPDIPSQANMTPSQAISGFMSDIQPWRKRGVLVSSPQIVYNTTWLAAFMSGIKAQGTDVDFMAIHYYGSWNDTATPQKYIQKIYNTYGKKIWITELGTTQSSNGTQAQQIGFMNTMLTWMQAQSYIDRVVWSGAWSVTSPPDNYIAVQDGMFYSNATLRQIGLEYAQISAATTPTSTSISSSSTSAKPTSTSIKTTSTTSTVHSTVPASTLVKSTSTPTSTHHSTTTSSSKKVTSTSTRKTTSSTYHHTSTSTKHHHHTTTSTKHHTSTSTKKASSTPASSKCRVLVNKGNVVRNWVERGLIHDQEEE